MANNFDSDLLRLLCLVRPICPKLLYCFFFSFFLIAFERIQNRIEHFLFSNQGPSLTLNKYMQYTASITHNL